MLFQIKGKKRFRNPEKKMHRVPCSRCGKETGVPFRPRLGRPVYCRRCFARVLKEKKAKEEAND